MNIWQAICSILGKVNSGMYRDNRVMDLKAKELSLFTIEIYAPHFSDMEPCLMEFSDIWIQDAWLDYTNEELVLREGEGGEYVK
jgi:hypothetical protein